MDLSESGFDIAVALSSSGNPSGRPVSYDQGSFYLGELSESIGSIKATIVTNRG